MHARTCSSSREKRVFLSQVFSHISLSIGSDPSRIQTSCLGRRLCRYTKALEEVSTDSRTLLLHRHIPEEYHPCCTQPHPGAVDNPHSIVLHVP